MIFYQRQSFSVFPTSFTCFANINTAHFLLTFSLASFSAFAARKAAMTAVKAGFEDGAVVVVVVVSTVAAVVDDDVVAVASPVVVFAAVEDVAVAVPSAGLSDAAAAALFLSPTKLGRRLIISCQKNLTRFLV